MLVTFPTTMCYNKMYIVIHIYIMHYTLSKVLWKSWYCEMRKHNTIVAGRVVSTAATTTAEATAVEGVETTVAGRAGATAAEGAGATAAVATAAATGVGRQWSWLWQGRWRWWLWLGGLEGWTA